MLDSTKIVMRAAELYPTIGRYAALRYVQIRGVHTRLYYLARLLSAAS